MIKLMATLTYIGIIEFSSNSNASNSRALFDLSPACWILSAIESTASYPSR